MPRKIATVRSPADDCAEEHDVIRVSPAVLRSWRLTAGSVICMRFGSAACEVKVQPLSVKRLPAAEEELHLQGRLCGELGLRGGLRLSLLYLAHAKSLYLGPLVGVLISRLYSSSAEMPFGSMTAFCQELVKTCEAAGVCIFFFSPEQMGSLPDVGGMYYDGEWRKRSFPVPHVIYNRLTSRKDEKRPDVRNFLKTVHLLYDTQIFNDKYLDKNDVFQALRNDPALQDYLPETYPFTTYQLLKTMSHRYPVLFLKPAAGSLGKGIFRLFRAADDHCQIRYTAISSTVTLHFQTLSHAYAYIAAKVRIQPYQIQQGLDLLTIGGRPVDFRALVQRDGEGKWVLSSLLARIAAEEHFVSNIARGGTMCGVQEALEQSRFHAMKHVIHTKLRKAALGIAHTLGSHVPGIFGELGIDLAVDTSGSAKLLEVNSKPSREEFTRPHPEQAARPSITRLVDYAIYLAKFAQ
ncbi:YheC/YheD family protein [Paenibacillus lutrae]|uniref:YheC/YheD family protein n=1 Tax=Paenibacillus lutrae TaxID=2078573 RepID=A0A7X3FK95_9BACL|nr:YheC/YheD family protein [Paenibacillus lutrae]MVP00887.1 YheC/YheD family protein [Paenibacillus lutrae]